MERFGRYQLQKRIGSGGMAEIYLARSASLDGFEKDVVVKRMRPELSLNDRFSSMFIEEGRISITLSHPNIVQVFDFGEHQGVYYLAMEYVDGCNLTELGELRDIKDVGLETPLALLIIGEVLKALDYAHNKHGRQGEVLNIVHRDVSPQNIMLSLDGAVKLGDFGIAKARGRPNHTNPGMVLGKLAYMAPEHLRGDPTDLRIDVYSCGVVLWELLVGQQLFANAVKERAFDRILAADIEPPSTRNPRLSPAVDALVMRALAKEPAARYSSAREFGEQAHAYLVRHHPTVNLYNLQSFVASRRGEIAARGIVPNGETRPLGTPMATPRLIADAVLKPVPTAVITPEGKERAWSDAILALNERFRRQPSLWVLLDLAEQCCTEGDIDAAYGCYRTAAVKFAQQGLLVQALLCCRHVLELAHGHGQAPPYEFVASMPKLVGQRDIELLPSLTNVQGRVNELLRDLLAGTQSQVRDIGQPTPILARLDGASFAELAMAAPLRKFGEGDAVVSQGDNGRTMYLLARGRVLIYAATPTDQRLYLSSLTAGDFFGENAFFTGALRSATVEAVEPTCVFELDRPLYNRVTAGHPEASGILLQFYKERVVDTVLAKSAVFGLLDRQRRRDVIELFTPRIFRDGEVIIRQGAHSDQIYLIKEGEAEVFTEIGGERTTLSTVGAGTIVGEIAALRGIPRTASVQAHGKLEVLELAHASFDAILASEPGLRQRVLDVVSQRARDNLDRLMGSATHASANATTPPKQG